MSIDYPFSNMCPIIPEDIEKAAVSLDEWLIVLVTGPDAKHYLQGQFTYNLNELPAGKVVCCAHCDPKGRVWSNLLLFLWNDCYYYLIRKDISTQQIEELKKYAVFAKVNINPQPSSYYLLGFLGYKIRDYLATYYTTLPSQQQNIVAITQDTLLIYCEVGDRYLLLSPTLPINLLSTTLPKFSSQQWKLADILAGWAVISPDTTGVLLPQAINLDLLDGISFDKGCYIGQEMITRATFRGMNKRALFLISGNSATTPKIGEQLAIELEKNSWKKTGLILNTIRTQDDRYWIQVILNKETPITQRFRLAATDNHDFTIQQLPYTITSP